MRITSSLFRTGSFAPLALIAVVFLVSVTIAAPRAHAAAVTLVTATTTSNNASTTLAKIGDTVSYQLVLSGTPAATTTPVINIFSMGTTTMAGSGTNWTYSTTTSAAWTNGFVTFNMAWGGTVGEATTTITQANLTSTNVRFDKTAPVISSLTSTATTTGALKVGDTIVFTVVSASPEVGGTVTGTYNSVPLTWSTTDGGTTFKTTYTVVEGQANQATPVQFSGITLRDAAGNTASGSTGDVLKTIDANSPATPVASVSSGTYTSAQSVSVSSTGADTIRYSLSSTAPTCLSGNIYSGPITITGSLPFGIIGCDTAGNTSSVATYNYVIQGGGGGRTFSGGGSGGGGGHTTSTPAPVKVSVPAVTTAAPASGSAVVAPAHVSFVRNLTAGVTGDDVKALQVFLNTHGFPIAATGIGSAGNETNSFGARTKAALAKFQASKGITPATGYFGVKTRAVVSGM